MTRIALFGCLLFLAIGIPARGELKVGVAAVNVTPEEGTPMAGYYSERGAEGTHDPLWAKAIVVESEGQTAALVALDLISTMRSFVEEARASIEKETGIPAANIMISGTHSHTGPVFSGSRRFDAISSANEKAVNYTKALPGMIAQAVKQAKANLAPASVAIGSAAVEGVAFNRRFHMRDGSVGWNPGKLNPNIVRPAGPVDEEVQVVYFAKEKTTPLAAYVNYPMHLDTVGGMHFSADYPFALGEILERIKGEDMLTVFTIGCAGDINHINVHSGQPQKGHEEAARIAAHLASGVTKVLQEPKFLTNTAVRVSSEMVKLPLAPISEADIAEARRVVEQIARKASPLPPFMQQVKAFQVLDVEERGGKPWQVEVQVIALGDQVVWVSLPGEIFVELGLSIKAGSPFQETIIATLANGSIGYIPTQRAYSEGNYEVISARCAEGSGEMLVASAIRQLRSLYKESSGVAR